MIHRYISVFDKNTERFCGEIPLDVDFGELRRLNAEAAEDDPLLVHEYEIAPADAEFYKNAGIALDFGRYDYFLSCADYDG